MYFGSSQHLKHSCHHHRPVRAVVASHLQQMPPCGVRQAMKQGTVKLCYASRASDTLQDARAMSVASVVALRFVRGALEATIQDVAVKDVSPMCPDAWPRRLSTCGFEVAHSYSLWPVVKADVVRTDPNLSAYGAGCYVGERPQQQHVNPTRSLLHRLEDQGEASTGQRNGT